MKISYIFRSKKRREHSIENVFESLFSHIAKKYQIESYYVPEASSKSLKRLGNNLKYVSNISGDILHITGDIHYVACIMARKKTVLTIHDMVQLEINKGLKRILIWFFWFYIPISRSRYITCISTKTYNDVIKMFPQSKGKVFVIPNPVDDRYTLQPKEFNKEEPKILVVGTRKNKNLERIIEAVKEISCILDIIGRLSEKQIKLLKHYNISYINSFNISNKNVIEKYKECDIVCFPSTYEGFGMPIIEGQAIGRVILTSNIEPMVEVAGGGACLVNPYEVASIREGLIRIINDDIYRDSIVRKGKDNCMRYTAETIARMYCNIYEKMR